MATVKAQFETVTPELAQEWLDHCNKMNRKVRDKRVRLYAEAMELGEFDTLNGDSIKFDTEDLLTDGQHRLLAQVDADVTLQYLVVRGVTPESRATLDDGVKRLFSDDLTMNGETNTSVLSSIYSKIMTWDTYGGLETWRKVSYTRKHLALRWKAYADQIKDTDLSTRHLALKWSLVGNLGAMQFMYWLLIHRVGADKRAVNRYLSIIAIGSQDPADEVLIRLRTKLQSNIRISRTGHKGYGNAKEEVYHMIRGWNAWLSGDYIGFQTPRNGYTDPYPMPILAVAGEKK